MLLIKLLSLSPFGRHTIIHCRRVIDISPLVKLQLIALVINIFNLSQNTFKISAVIPSIPGVLLCFIFFKTMPISFTFKGSPNFFSVTDLP